ncbi:protein Skeletor, isoforms B/C-like [Oppia nitens]|uniref:protein Skeletor, isoforms B/C-like n=1 Tax=Oppia nitens TaxID=1686743 RepID=UPI0023DB60F0|nr:protein Skeletor, isoforms B/C-like [Oppia nitens]
MALKLLIVLTICSAIIIGNNGQREGDDEEVDNNVYQSLGSLPTYAHGLSGQVFADLSDRELRTVRIKHLYYDGAAPDAYFWAGNSDKPDTTGFIIPDENGLRKPLKGYTDADIVLKLPSGKTLNDIKWLAVWCRRYRENFGNVNLV